MPEGTLLKLVFTTKAGLGSGWERRWMLFESLHSVWRCPHGCGACYPQKKNTTGATCLFKNPHMNTLEWAQFILVSYAGNLGRNIKTLVALVHPHLNITRFPQFSSFQSFVMLYFREWLSPSLRKKYLE